MLARLYFGLIVVISSVIVLVHCRKNWQKDHDCTWLKEELRGSFLWRIERKVREAGQKPDAYLLGTVHAPYREIWPYMPRNTKMALRLTDAVYTELDLTDKDTIDSLTKCRRLHNPQESLANLSQPIYRRVLNYFASVTRRLNHRPAGVAGVAGVRHAHKRAQRQFKYMSHEWTDNRLIWILLMINDISDMIASYEYLIQNMISNPHRSAVKRTNSAVLDLYLTTRANKQRKIVGAIEKVQDQCNPLNKLNSSLVLLAMEETLDRLDAIEHKQVDQSSGSAATSAASPLASKGSSKEGGRNNTPWDSQDTRQMIIDHYNCGALDTSFNSAPRLNKPSSAGHSALQKLDNYFRNSLLFHRNKRMAVRISRVLRQNPGRGYVFAIGAGHLVGVKTIQEQLESKGYVITHIARNTPLTKRIFSLSVPKNPNYWRQSRINHSEEQRLKVINWKLAHFGKLWRSLSLGRETFYQQQNKQSTPSPYQLSSASFSTSNYFIAISSSLVLTMYIMCFINC